MNILDNIISPNNLVFDVGCNTGGKAQEFLNRNCKVVGFEPQPKCIDQLRKKFKDDPNIVIEPIGLDYYEGQSYIYTVNNEAITSINSMSLDFINTTQLERFKEFQWNGKTEILVSTLDKMITKHGTPAYIKIDVEGYELNVLRGLTSKIDVISLEFTPELCKNSIKCIEYLEELNGLCKFNYGYREDNDFKFSWMSKDEIIKYLESVNDFKYEFGDIYIRSIK